LTRFNITMASASSSHNSRSLLLLPLCVVVAVFAFWLLEPHVVRDFRYAMLDQYQRWQPRTYESAPVLVVDIDEASLAKVGQWPWPRTKVARLADELRAAGASVVAFDVMFAEADRTSPSAMGDLWAELAPGAVGSGALREQLASLPDHDQWMGRRIQDGGKVVLGAMLQTSASAHGQLLGSSAPAPVAGHGDVASAPDGRALRDGGRPDVPMPVSVPYRFVLQGEPVMPWVHGFDTRVDPLPVLSTGASGLGALNFVSDGDGVIRKVPLIFANGAQLTPSLVAESLRVAQATPNIFVRANTAGVESVRIGRHVIPTTPQGELWMHYTPYQPERYVSAWRVLEGLVERDQLQGRMVLVGASAQGLMDLRFNPLGRVMPGVEAHAQALEQIVLGHYVVRPSWISAVEVLLLLSGGLLVGWLALQTSAVVSGAAAVGASAGLLLGGWLAFTQAGVLLDVSMPLLGVVASFVLASGVHHFLSERRQRWVKAAFSRYVSPNKVDYLVDHPDELQLGGKRQQCSFIFTDLAGFTTLMETMDPADAVNLLNQYLDGMVGIAFKHQGTLDRIMGDAVAVVFSAPVEQPNHCQLALDCAMAMDAFATEFTREQGLRGVPFGKTRIGVHAGEVIVGNFGGTTMFDYRALGDPVNTAARLESVNKHLGTRFCVSDVVVQASSAAAPMRPVGRLVLKGKSKPLKVYEPMMPWDEATRAPYPMYAAAFERLEQPQPGASPLAGNLAGDDAVHAFDVLAAQYPHDPLVNLHLNRLRAGETSDLMVMTDK
jgi:adenylate cyclase